MWHPSVVCHVSHAHCYALAADVGQAGALAQTMNTQTLFWSPLLGTVQQKFSYEPGAAYSVLKSTCSQGRFESAYVRDDVVALATYGGEPAAQRPGLLGAHHRNHGCIQAKLATLTDEGRGVGMLNLVGRRGRVCDASVGC